MSSEWPEYSLLEIYNVTNGLNKNRKEFGFGYPFLTFKEVFANYFVPEELTSLANTDPKERNKCSIQAGDVFITRTSETFDELGMSCVATKDYPDASFNGFCKRLRPNGTAEIDAQYSAFFFNGPEFRQQVLSLANMSTRASLNNDMLKKLTIKLPPLDVQRGIAKVLTDLHDKIRINNQINQTLEQMAQAIFKSWFVDFEPVKAKIAALETGGSAEDALFAAMQAISGKGKAALTRLQAEQPEQYAELRATAELFPSAMQDSELGEIPEGWDATTFGAVSICLDKHRIPLSKAQRENRKGQIPYYGATSIMDYVDEPIFDGIYLLIGEDGSVLREDGTPFTQYIWGKSWVNNHAHVIQGTNHISTEQLLLFLKDQNITPYVTGAVQLKLNQKNMNSIPFVKAEQRVCKAFDKLVSPMFAEIRSRHDESTTLTEVRNALLPRLFAGLINLKDIA